MTDGYPYDRGDRFAQPEYYMFSRFTGVPFLRDYARSREAGAARLRGRYAAALAAGGRASLVEALPPLPGGPLPDSAPGSAFGEGAAEVSATADALLRLAAILPRERGADPDLMFYLGRFEVTKRLRTAYPQRGQGEGEPDGPLAHALLQLCCGLHHAATGSLKTLNGLLKLGDVACSDAFAVAGPDALHAALCGLALESEAVQRLGWAKGVTW